MDERLLPGAHPEGIKSCSELFPCGKCDGVLWLKDFPGSFTNERHALRYLRPMSQYWKSMNKQIGFSRPHGIEWLFPDELFELSQRTGRPIRHLFTCDDYCINIVKTEKTKWKAHKISEELWAVLYA